MRDNTFMISMACRCSMSLAVWQARSAQRWLPATHVPRVIRAIRAREACLCVNIIHDQVHVWLLTTDCTHVSMHARQ